MPSISMALPTLVCTLKAARGPSSAESSEQPKTEMLRMIEKTEYFTPMVTWNLQVPGRIRREQIAPA
jgi:hypothetical protein